MSTKKKSVDVVYGSGIYTIHDDGRVDFGKLDPTGDIVRALSFEPRFGGHCAQFYSVAEHSINVAERVYELTHNPTFALQGLWHEAAEGLGFRDINGPLKHQYGGKLVKMEQAVTKQVFEQFLGLPFPIDQAVVQVDHEYAQVEGRVMVPRAASAFVDPGWTARFRNWEPAAAEDTFRQAHRKFAALRLEEGKK